MKKYLTLVAVLGAVVFLSVSYLAKAEPENGAAMTATTAAEPAAAPGSVPSSGGEMNAEPAKEMTAYEKDFAECEALASASMTEGAVPSAEEKAASCKKCMMGKGHTEEEIKAEEEKKKASDAAAAPATMDAPVATDAPAAAPAETEKH